jgi:hypothetical protein
VTNPTHLTSKLSTITVNEVKAKDASLASGKCFQTSEKPKKARLSRTVGTRQYDDGPFFNIEIHTTQQWIASQRDDRVVEMRNRHGVSGR